MAKQKKDRRRYYKRLTRAERQEIKRSAKANAGITGDRSKISRAIRKGSFKVGKVVGLVDKRRHFVDKGGEGNYLGKKREKDEKVDKGLLKAGAEKRYFESLDKGDEDKDIVKEDKGRRINVRGNSEEEVKRKYNDKLKEKGEKGREDVGKGALTSTWEQNERNKADANEQSRRARYIKGSRTRESEINKDKNDSLRGSKGKSNGSNKLSKRALYRKFKKEGIRAKRKSKGLKPKFRKFDSFTRRESIK